MDDKRDELCSSAQTQCGLAPECRNHPNFFPHLSCHNQRAERSSPLTHDTNPVMSALLDLEPTGDADSPRCVGAHGI
ncbi:hypothetical protein EYF80_067373 [Liparis tanakae]|uniref:Uncharacterized protein n=1 Tax=Liparis tanakae TaxID=230148 RepID=A0A4Z2E174_9TELE|nr:hypothetical protein EYF80_067373 [Liparis tanakae]